MDETLKVKAAFSALLKNISPARRRLLSQQIGRQLARNQRKRIKAQQNPDGSAYEPRKRKKKSKKGRIKQMAMFKKITAPRYMKLRNGQDKIELGFSGNTGYIANVHQQGLRARVMRHHQFKVKYAQRELLGFTDEDREMIEDFVIKALAEPFN
ncbi:phage virion morphogenesis protein [Caviibacterium pharyngocola]|uniref:Phage virion morphogenesis protein n=1 Tax=Caviibacterium pharyngocola TaxID=28159 RepID=A0A2M8RTA1_9PAST|nr:phage virion morphogenesis protein [Caviibacterium pharyngocola]PJG82122.1 phage virion morphogenesis protein [Caviibacterium pharyngocola]